MDYNRFNMRLKEAGLSKKEFGAIIGTSGATISNWGNEQREIPYWVASWLDLYIENLRYRDLKDAIKKIQLLEH